MLTGRKRQAVNVRELTAYLEGDVTPQQIRDIEDRLASCASSRQCLEQLRRVTDAVAGTEAEEQTIDLVAGVRRAAAQPQVRSASRWPSWRRSRLPMVAGLAATAAALLFLLPIREEATHSDTTDELPVQGALGPGLRVKASGPTGDDRWIDLQVYRTNGKDSPQRVAREVRRDDALLFAYTNLGPRPYDHLMVFAIAGKGKVHWFYPGYERRGGDPQSIAIEQEQAGAELPDVVKHDLAPGLLTLYAVFSREPLSVLRVEALIRDLLAAGRWDPREAARVPLEGTAQRIMSIQVR